MATNELAAEQFAKSFAPDVVVLEPEGMRKNLKADLQKIRGLIGK